MATLISKLFGSVGRAFETIVGLYGLGLCPEELNAFLDKASAGKYAVHRRAYSRLSHFSDIL